MRTLPEQLRAAVPATHAHVGVEIKDRVFGQFAVTFDERLGMPQLSECAPDGLMNTERMRILHERSEEKFQRFLWTAVCREMSRQRQSRAPILGAFFDDTPTKMGKPIR